MNIEIEAKMRLADAAALEARLRELGATPVAELVETNTFFDTPQHALKSADRGLRVRTEQMSDGRSRSVITHKGPRAHGKLKSRSETEVVVEDAADAAALLTELGFFAVLSFEKRRRRWSIDGCLVEIDTLPHLGDFVEIEGPGDEAVLALRDKLGLADAPLVRASYIAMLVAHLREHNIRTSHVPLESAAVS